LAGIATSALVGPTYANTLQPDPALTAVPIEQQLTNQVLRGTENPSPNTEGVVSILGPDVSLANQTGLFPSQVSNIAPNPGPVLSPEQETAVQDLIQKTYNVPAKAELEGIRLNAVYGVIAGEQHLPLYPGDKVANHTTDPTRKLTGMVPGLPAWGYFEDSKDKVTDVDREAEEYYIAAQTFLAPGWKQNVPKYYEWFHGRKMIMINPETGNAVVVRIEDAGPSPSLHRTFGGSNEVIQALGLGRIRTAPVYGFFVDDPNDTIRLGPVGGVPYE
jgi:hypothetical protein